MSNKKNLLEEGTVRKFMGLAGLKPITVSNFVGDKYVNELEDPARKDKRSDLEKRFDKVPKDAGDVGGDKASGLYRGRKGAPKLKEEDDVLDEEFDLTGLEEELGEELYEQEDPMDEEPLEDEEPEMDMGEEPPMGDEPEMDMEEEPAEEEKEVTIDPEEAEVLVKLADKLRDLVGEPEEEEELGGEEELGLGDEEGLPPEGEEPEEEEMMMEQLVHRIASRVAKRLLEKKKAAPRARKRSVRRRRSTRKK